MKCSRFAIVLLAALLISFSSYYQSNQSFNRAFQSGQLTDALASVQSGAYKKNSNQFLYQVNSALILSMLGKYDKSNELFEQAFIYGEDYRANYLYEAASYLTNPTFTSYKGEDHEHLMVLYYKALNYLKEKKNRRSVGRVPPSQHSSAAIIGQIHKLAAFSPRRHDSHRHGVDLRIRPRLQQRLYCL